MMDKKWSKWLVSGMIAAAVLAFPLYSNALTSLGKAAPVYAADAGTQTGHVITVNGEGEMTVQPDVAYVNLGIQTKAETANDAQQQNADAFAKLQSVLYNDYKLDPKDVKTSGFNVYPDYSYPDKEQPKITGYTATQTLTVTYRDLGKLGTFLDSASAAGVNLINGIQFGTEKGKDYELQVIQKAMANAEDKAKVIAQYAGKDLKGIVNVTQNGGSGGVPVPMYSVSAAAAKDVAMNSASTSISGGELKITTSVTVTFEF